MSTPKLAIQLYSLRHEFEKDAEGTLRSVRGLGYGYIELAGTYGWSADKWKKLLAETGLKVVGAHMNPEELTTGLAKQIEFQKAIGNHRYILSSLSGEKHTVEGFTEAAKIMNAAAEKLKAEKGEVLYHNHDFEFQKLGGLTGYAILLKETDPKLVKFEVDTYWVEKGGMDAAEFVAEHANRIGTIHAKELRRADQSEAAAGGGDINFPAIVELARKHDWPVIVEYEGEDAPAVVKKSAAYLSGLIAGQK